MPHGFCYVIHRISEREHSFDCHEFCKKRVFTDFLNKWFSWRGFYGTLYTVRNFWNLINLVPYGFSNLSHTYCWTTGLCFCSWSSLYFLCEYRRDSNIFCNRNIVPSPWENITNATYFKVKYKANHNFIVFVSWHRGVRSNDIICIHVLGQYSNDLLRVREKKPEANGKSDLAWISRRSLLICISRSIRISYFL